MRGNIVTFHSSGAGKACFGAFIVLALSASVALAQSADPANHLTPGGGPVQTPAAFGDNAIDFVAGSGGCGNNSEQTIGWQFDVVNTVSVSAMAWFDEYGDGLQLPHEVGIWDPSGTLIEATHVLIPFGTTATLDGIWRIVEITPAELLLPGDGYIIGGYNGSGQSECLSSDVDQTVHPNLAYFDATFALPSSRFDRPTMLSLADNGFYGVGFQIGGEQVPATTGLGVILLVLALCGGTAYFGRCKTTT